MTTDIDIRRHVGRYLKGEITLRTLRSKLTPIRWDTEHPPTPEASRMLGPLGRYFAEFSNGDWTEAELRDRLLPFGPVIAPVTMTIRTLASTSSSGSVSPIEVGSLSTVSVRTVSV